MLKLILSSSKCLIVKSYIYIKMCFSNVHVCSSIQVAYKEFLNYVDNSVFLEHIRGYKHPGEINNFATFCLSLVETISNNAQLLYYKVSLCLNQSRIHE